MGPDVLALKARPRAGPDVPVGNPAAARFAVAVAPPRVRVAAAAPAPPPRPRNHLAVRHRSGDEVVAFIDLVSPGNKAAADAFRRFVNKAVRAVRAGVHLVVIDPFPPTPRDPAGVHGAIWPRLGGDPFTPPAGKPLTLAAYEAGFDGPRCYVEPTAVGRPLIDLPLFLEPGEYIPLPLEATYQAAFADVLPQDRAALEA
jgi:hypothetical protein